MNLVQHSLPLLTLATFCFILRNVNSCLKLYSTNTNVIKLNVCDDVDQTLCCHGFFWL